MAETVRQTARFAANLGTTLRQGPLAERQAVFLIGGAIPFTGMIVPRWPIGVGAFPSSCHSRV